MYNKIQGIRVISVTPNDNINLIHPSDAPAFTGAGTLVSGNQYNFTTLTAADGADKLNVNDTFVSSTSTVVGRVVAIDTSGSTTLVTFDVSFGATATGSFYASVDLNDGAILYVGSGGDIAIETIGGDDVVVVGAVTGSTIYIQCAKVKATGTSASSILAIW